MADESQQIDFRAIFEQATARQNAKRRLMEHDSLHIKSDQASRASKKQKKNSLKADTLTEGKGGIGKSSFKKNQPFNLKNLKNDNDGHSHPRNGSHSGKYSETSSVNSHLKSSDDDKVSLEDSKRSLAKNGSNKNLDSTPKKKSGRWNFEVDYNDHFETSFDAIRDFSIVLEKLCKFLKKRPEKLIIYDPYFCMGNVKRHYARLGFPKVVNENRDFYADIAAGTIPEYDILITNPPYSEDHKTKILNFCIKSGKPWALLMPNYIANKKYYLDIVSNFPTSSSPAATKPFFLHPLEKYEYEHPEGTGHEQSPFDSLWFVHLGSLTDAVFSACKASMRLLRSTTPNSAPEPSTLAQSYGNVSMIRTVEELRESKHVPTEKRPNPKMRKKLKALREAEGEGKKQGRGQGKPEGERGNGKFSLMKRIRDDEEDEEQEKKEKKRRRTTDESLGFKRKEMGGRGGRGGRGRGEGGRGEGGRGEKGRGERGRGERGRGGGRGGSGERGERGGRGGKQNGERGGGGKGHKEGMRKSEY